MAELIIAGRTVILDDADLELIAGRTWHIHKSARTCYVRGFVSTNRPGGLVYMHRIILGARRGQMVDHINGDGLDNRRANLRLCTRTQNAANRHHAFSATGVKGVHFEAHTQRYRAEIHCDRRRYTLGRFDTLEAAAAAYARKAGELFGEFACPVQVNSK